MPHISVIIPATNEEAFVVRAIQSVRRERYPKCEIIVVVNGSRDATASVARRRGVRVIEFKKALLAGGARNAGARAARGNWLVFLDADSEMGKGVLRAIARCSEKEFGTVLGGPLEKKLLYYLFFGIKNTAHRFGFYRGALGGLFFCSAYIFRAIRGYDSNLKVNEISDIVSRALAYGAEYKLLTTATAYTSMRRFEQLGVVRPLIFWMWVKLAWIFEGQRSRIGKAYAVSTDRLFR